MKPVLRKPTHIALLLLILVLPFLGSTSGPEGEVAIPEISTRINAFTLDLLKHEAQAADAPGNTVLSAQSIFHGLALSYVAAGGDTRAELAKVLHFPDDNRQLIDGLATLRQQLHASAKPGKIEISVATSAWLDGTHARFRKEYADQVQQAFAASLHSVQFKQPDQVSQEINNWVSEKTHGKITKSVGPQDFKSKSTPGVIDEPALVTVNAVYFKADWGSRFEKGSTREHPFHVDAATTEPAPMMHQRSVLLYAEDDRVQFLEIPYVDGSYSMYVLLPQRILSVKSLMDLVTIDRIIALKRGAFPHQVDVLLPKFEIGSHLGVKNALGAMGVQSAFDSQRADFDKMITKTVEAYRVYLNEVYHDAWIDVHEEGTEAAAATTAVHYSFGCSMQPGAPPPVDFHADHPFLYMIVHNQSRSVLFAGWISRPKQLARPSRPASW